MWMRIIKYFRNIVGAWTYIRAPTSRLWFSLKYWWILLRNPCKKIKRNDEDELYCSLSCFDWENDGKKLLPADWAPLMDELSILANANVGETDAECDINRLAEQGAVYCNFLEDLNETCNSFAQSCFECLNRVNFVSLIILITTWQFDLTIWRPKFIGVHKLVAPHWRWIWTLSH